MPRAPSAQGAGDARPQIMSETNDADTKKKRRAKALELKLTGISYNVGPDATDRLKRFERQDPPVTHLEMSRGVENERE